MFERMQAVMTAGSGAMAHGSAVTSAYQFDETPVDEIPLYPFIIAMVVFIVLAVAIAVVAFMPRKPKKSPVAVGQPEVMSVSEIETWHGRVEKIRRESQAEEISDDDAYLELAKLCRDFASARLGSNLQDSTLTDIRRNTVSSPQRDGMQSLRQTITALYPPEFANPESNAQAQQATVGEACDWVDTLIERWR
ncbi:MAG: hypothetical protein PUF97_04005 [Bifidobacteriaceae bacterium]|nr:hypothetical protein [Bifidobacteriaceae bacterium]